MPLTIPIANNLVSIPFCEVIGMFFIDLIPHLRVYHSKVIFPVDKKIQSMYSMAFLNNASIDSSIGLINNPKISHNNRFHNYYIDNVYTGKFFGRNYREVKTKERYEIYDQIESKTSNINGQNVLSAINSKNFFYDLYFYNTIFFDMSKRAMTFRQKSEEYLTFLKTTFNDPKFQTYTNKIILIDVDSWVQNLKKDIRGTKFYDNPIFMIYFSMLKNFDKFKDLGDMNIIFCSEGNTLRLNPSIADKNSHVMFRNELARLSNNKFSLADESKIEKDLEKGEVYDHVVRNFVSQYNFTGDDDSSELEDKVKNRLDELVDTDSNLQQTDGKDLEDKLTSEIINDEKVLKDINDIVIQNRTGKETVSSKRDQVLRDKQKELKLENHTLEDMQKLVDRNSTIDSFDISDKVKTTNTNVTKIKYPNFEKAYNEHLLKRDMMNTLTSLNERSIPVFIRKIEVEDTSDELSFKETYTVNLEDANRVRHTLKYDMPKFIDNKFMYLNGNKKMIVKQQLMKPVTKTGPDEVQIVSNYNKIFIRRYGQKTSSKLEKFKKAIGAMKLGTTFNVKYGNNTNSNAKFLTTIEYDELAKEYTSLRFKNVEFLFNQNDVQKILKEKNIKIREGDLCIGFMLGKDPITLNLDSQLLGDMDIIDFILSIDEGKIVRDAYDDATSGKKFVYSRATIMAKQVPLILLLGYLEGLSTVLRKASITHSFTDKRPKDLNHNQGFVQFSDGYLIYEKYPFENSLLMNAFADIPTKGFTYAEFDEKDAYLTIFDSMYSSKIIGNAFGNFYELMIDPITKEVLEDLHYPTDFVNLILFANAMLADNSFTKENHMSLYRVRSNELVNAYLYKAISTAYINYRLTANNNNPVKISVPRDVVTKQILMAQTVEDYSTLNPIVELEKSRAITTKGPSGLNLDQAYTQDKRSYDRSMLGIIAMSTSPDANVGVVRQLTLEPNIISARGYIEIQGDDLSKVKDANLFSPAELLSPLGVTKDDSNRTAMATKQSKHIIPVEKSSPVLISNGTEQIIPYHLSNDFTVVAKMDGEVVEIDEKTGLVIVEYYLTDGRDRAGKNALKEHQAIDISPRIVKNGAGGFYLSNKLMTNLKVGQKFKKNDILASDEKFFTRSKVDGVRFNIGSLQKVACMSSYSTYEDSTFITKKLSEDMASDIVMSKTVVLGKNASVDYIVKVGDKITVGDDLIRFEASFDDDSLNKFLATIGDSLKEEIQSLGKTPIKSKYTGVIEDIKIYSTVDLDEMSPTLQKIAGSYYNRIDKKRNILNKYDKSKSSYKMGVILNEPTGKIESKDGKIKGNEVGEGVLIEIFIKYRDVMGIGDKLAFFTALKSINGEVIAEGYEPYSEFRPDEEVSSFIAPGAVLARMTPSILLTMFGNKVLVELKRSLQEIYTGKPWEGPKA
jgi:hypothetical protein